jgi:hypothetical protein
MVDDRVAMGVAALAALVVVLARLLYPGRLSTGARIALDAVALVLLVVAGVFLLKILAVF